MKKLKKLNENIDAGISEMAPELTPELLACRACLATDTKLYQLSGVLKDTYQYLMSVPLTTNLVRSVDRVSHKLLLKFTLGIDTKVIDVVHDENDDMGEDKVEEQITSPPKKGGTLDKDDSDRFTDVLNDFDEIAQTLNDDVDLEISDNEFTAGSPCIDRAKNFNVEELFRGKINSVINEMSSTSISHDVGDISKAFKGKGFNCKKSSQNALISVKNEDTNSTFRDAEEVLKANINNHPPDITFNYTSIQTNDFTDTDSNLVDTFNNFIRDHGFLDEKLLFESGDAEFVKKQHVISKKTDDDSLLSEITPNLKKDKKVLLKQSTTKNTHVSKPVKNLFKLKEINKRAKRSRSDKIVQEIKPKELNEESKLNLNDNKSDFKPITIKPELPIDDKVKSELSKDFIKFGADFNFRIFKLSREEQAEELQKKKEGVLYLAAMYKCENCAKGFRTAVTFGNHMKVHEPSYGSFECDICHSRHKSDARRRRHGDTHRFKYCCTQCEFVGRCREKAEAHYQWHAGKTFRCQHCGEQFGKVSTHLSHIRLHHPDACAWCPQCGEAFVGALGLRQHTRRKHASRDSGALAVQSTDSASVQCHERPQPPPPPLPPLPPPPAPPPPPRRRAAAARAVCELCGKKYHSAAALSYHKRTHTGERPYACSRCPKTFTHNHSLQAHVRTHTGERPFRCPRCPRAFLNANNLARHKKTVHLGQREYARCAACARWFSSPHAARAHAACAHGGRPWPRRKQATTTTAMQ